MKYIKVLISIGILILLQTAVLFAQQRSESDDFSYALKLYNEKLYHIAAQQFSRFTTNYVGSNKLPEAGFYSGMSLFYLKDYENAMKKAKHAYDIIAQDFAEEAQYVVPMAYNLHWYFNINLRSLQWLCELRSSPAGHPNYRYVAQEMAKQVFKVPRVIARVNDPKRESLFKELEIDAIVCPTTIAAAHLRNAVMHPDLITILTVTGGNIEINEMQVKGSAVGKSLKELNLPKESTVAAIIRDRETLIPSGDTIIQECDVAVVVNLSGISDEVRNILCR